MFRPYMPIFIGGVRTRMDGSRAGRVVHGGTPTRILPGSVIRPEHFQTYIL